MTQNVDTKVKLMPMTIGSRLPRGPMGNICSRDPIPAIIMAVWTRLPVSSVPKCATPATIKIGAMLATNMARTCCRPNGTAFCTEMRPSSS